jgi:multiple sugar transport system permease protein
MEAGRRMQQRTKGFRSLKRQTNLAAYAMLAPDLIGLAVFIFLPILMALYVSLHDWDAFSPMQYVGLDNYINLLSDSDWWRSLAITALYSVAFVALVFFVSLFLANYLGSLKSAQELFRTLYFIPFAVSTVVASMIWLFMYNDKTGFINAALRFLGIPPQRFLADPKQALLCIALTTAWMNIGYYTIIFLAAMKDIPRSYYEAAMLDGANWWSVFRRITFPLLREVSAFVLVVTTIASFQVFDQVKIMTNGGPANATNVTVFYIYRQAFEFIKLGYSSSLAFVLFIVIFSISIFQLRLTRSDTAT